MNKWLWVICLSFTSNCFAHKSSESYFFKDDSSSISAGRLLISVRDMDRVLELDHNHDGAISKAEVEQVAPLFTDHVAQQITAKNGETECPLNWQWAGVLLLQQEYFVQLNWHSVCADNLAALTINYALFSGIDTQHKVFMQHAENSPVQVFSSPAEMVMSTPSKGTIFLTFLAEGAQHIWAGYDHLLFLLCLLLPAAFTRKQGQWRMQRHATRVLKDMLKLITGFTLGHSVTLSVATMQWVTLPSVWVESVIAFSVFLAALNLRWAIFKDKLVLVTFLFGLVHGFGFASALAELTLSTEARALSLLAFNVGVELGQIVVLMPLIPLLLRARYYSWYPNKVLPVSSFFIALTALFWLTERLAYS